MEVNEAYILLSVQSALTTHISPFLRAVTVDFDKHESMLTLQFFYDGEVNGKLFDLASCTSAEIDLGTFDYTLNDKITTRLDYPQKIPIQGRLVYLRKEPTPTLFQQKSAVELAGDSVTLSSLLLLAMQDSLLGKITPELRRVIIGVENDSQIFDFYFYYDGEISIENWVLASSAIDDACTHFPEYSANRNILRLDFPKKFPNLGTRCI